MTALVINDPPISDKVTYALFRDVIFKNVREKYVSLTKMNCDDAKEFMYANPNFFIDLEFLLYAQDSHCGFPNYSIDVAKALVDDDTQIAMHHQHIVGILWLLGMAGKLELMKKLLDKYRVDLSKYPSNELTRELFIDKKSFECLEYLISKGAQVDEICYTLAVEYSNKKAIELLENKFEYTRDKVIVFLESNESFLHILEKFKKNSV